MAYGDIKSKYQSKRAVCIMTAQSVASGPPALATDGVPSQPTGKYNSDDGHGFQNTDPTASTLMVKNTAGTGAVVGTFVLWGYLEANATWFPIKVNAGAAVATYSTDKTLYVERFSNLGHYDRLYLELQAPGQTAGTATFEAWLATGKSGTATL
jgi:hypothetical protein